MNYQFSNLPSMQEMISLYLYGTPTKPADMTDESIANRTESASVTINTQAFMTEGAGKYVSAGNFKVVRKFLAGEYQLEVGTYNAKELFKELGVPTSNQAIGVRNYLLDVDSPDYVDRSYVFGSMDFTIHEKTEFIVGEDGTFSIKGFALVPVDDNFDYQSNSTIATITNYLTKDVIDPYNIGKEVVIKFTNEDDDYEFVDLNQDDLSKILSDYADFQSIYNKSDFPQADIAKLIDAVLNTNKTAYKNALDDLLGSDVLSYIDENRLVAYGSNSQDTLSHDIVTQYIRNLNSLVKYFGSDKAYNYLNSVLRVEGDIYVAGKMDDKVIGSDKSDILYGGDNDDLLDGGEGNDVLVGGQGNDTYIIEGNDTIFDSDGEGKIIINDNALSDTFYKKSDNIWMTEDKAYTAHKQGNNLLIINNQNTDRSTIQDYFIVAKTSGDTTTAIGITLDEKPEEAINPNKENLQVNQNYHSNIYLGKTDTEFNILGGQKGDLVFGYLSGAINIDLQSGSDMIYGSQYADTIYGNADNDIIFGGLIKSEISKKEDNDTLYGGSGTDYIMGMQGNDIIYSEDQNSHLSTLSLNERGDIVTAGDGDDSVYGSANQDLLTGGQGIDTIYAGASDDVIIGDGNIRGDYSTLETTETQPSIGFEAPYPTAPLIPIIGQPVLINPPTKTQMVDYTFDLSKPDNWDKYYKDNVKLIKQDSFEWEISIEQETGDYSFTSKVNKHIVDQTEADYEYNDYIYAGAGNDLAIGQYGHDILYGEEGDDILWGDDNRDTSISGSDILIAGKGNDTLFGGFGFDTYQFSIADLSDASINTINDLDNSGRLLIGNDDWRNKTWQSVTDALGYNQWTDNEGNHIRDMKDGSYLISSDNFTANISIEGTIDSNNQLLGMTLITNQAPQVDQTAIDQVVTADEAFSISLANNLFTDPDGDELTYSIDNLPTWASFDSTTNTITGTAPIGIETQLTLTATDPSGETASQSFILKSNAKPQLNTPLDSTLYLSSNDDSYVYQLPSGTFSDADGDSLTYSLSMIDGNDLPAGINIDANTGAISVDGTQASSTQDDGGDTIHNLQITATDSQGVSVTATTQLHISDSLIEAEAGFNMGSLSDDIVVVSDNTESDNTDSDTDSSVESHTINALAGDDVVIGGAGSDTIRGGIGNDLLNGHTGDDTLLGGTGNDTLVGGLDADRLVGGMGDDTYIYQMGDGHDTIRDWTGEDTLVMTDFSLSDLLVSTEGDDLVIRFDNSDTDSVTIEAVDAFLVGGLYHIEQIKLADQTVTTEGLLG